MLPEEGCGHRSVGVGLQHIRSRPEELHYDGEPGPEGDADLAVGGMHEHIIDERPLDVRKHVSGIPFGTGIFILKEENIARRFTGDDGDKRFRAAFHRFERKYELVAELREGTIERGSMRTFLQFGSEMVEGIEVVDQRDGPIKKRSTKEQSSNDI